MWFFVSGFCIVFFRLFIEKIRLLGVFIYGYLCIWLTVILAGVDTGRRSEGRERFLLCFRFFSCSFFWILFISYGLFFVN